MRIDKRAKREAKQLLSLCVLNSQIDDGLIRKVVQATLAADHRNMGPVLRYFLRLLRLDRARRSATVESAVALPLDAQIGTQNRLSQRYGSTLPISFVERPSLIGGMRVQVGYDVWDGSIRAGLLALERKF